MPKCTDEAIEFGRVGRRVVQDAFDGGDIVSDGGVLFLKRVDERLGLTRSAAVSLGDESRGASVANSMHSLLAQRIYGLTVPGLAGCLRPQRAAQRSGHANRRGPCRAAGVCAHAEPAGDRGHAGARCGDA